MTEQVFGGHLGTSVTIDICSACQVFWFDARESLQLAPASTLRLFRTIGEAAAAERRALATNLTCPRCRLTLKAVQDLQRNTRFTYRRCPGEHGRLITFFDFLREKNFVKPMSAEQLVELRSHLDAVNCSNCGASVDLARASACQHCGSALSILDASQAERLVAQLRAADRTGQPVDPALPLSLEQARRSTERLFEQLEGSTWSEERTSSDPVLAGLQSLARWLARTS
jgi:hypothetical protein